MRVAFILPSLANKGPIIMARTLINELILHDTICDVYYFDELLDLDFSCSTRKIRFFEAIDFSSYDVIHSHLFRPDLYCAYHKNKICKSGAKVVTTIHTAIYQDLSFTYNIAMSKLIILLWERAWKQIDHAVVLTETAKIYYQHIGFSSVTVIHNGISIPDITEPVSKDDLEIINQLKQYTLLGTVCAMDARKGLEQVLHLLAEEKQYAFLIVGDGTERAKLENLADAYGISDRFKVLGFRKDGYRYLTYFDQFVITSRSEGMPIALLEAMAYKVPVVASRIPAFTFNFSDDDLNYFDLDHIDSLIQACNQARFIGKEKCDQAFLHYQKDYTAVQMVIKYLSYYQSIFKIQ